MREKKNKRIRKLKRNNNSTEKSLIYSELNSPAGVNREGEYIMTTENNEQVNEESTNIDEGQAQEKPTDESLKTEEQTKDNDSKHIPYDRFKAKVDEANALKEKLAEIEKAQEETKRKELEEQNEYKQLYEQALQQAEQAKQEALSTKKSALLTQAGYDAEQAQMLVTLVEGETDDEISESIKRVQATIPAKDGYGDPSAFNGAKAKPETVGADDIAATQFERIKNKIFG